MSRPPTVMDLELILATEADRAALGQAYREHLEFLARWNRAIDVRSPLDEQWFTRPDVLFPWLLVSDGALAGFGLMGNYRLAEAMGSEADYYLHEFHVRASHRRRGLGRVAIERLRTEHAGRWCVDVLPVNRDAIDFWSALLLPLGAEVAPHTHSDGIEYARYSTPAPRA